MCMLIHVHITHQKHWHTSTGWEESDFKTFQKRNEIILQGKTKLGCSFNQRQIQPCLNAYLITSTLPFFSIKARGKISLNGGIWTLVWNIEKYMKEEPCIPLWISQTITAKSGAEWREVLVVVERILCSPVKLLSHTTEYNTIWVSSVILILSRAI